MSELLVYTDGGARGNPGPSAIGVAIYQDSKLIHSIQKYIGISTNNIAEYTALFEAIDWIVKQNTYTQYVRIVCKLDSELVVQQMNGIYKIKNPNLKNIYYLIQQHIAHFSVPIIFIHIPREQNQEADRLVNFALDNHLVV
jgi:ribonuclease HI